MAYVIKRYSNRKLYDTQESRYVTLEELEERLAEGQLDDCDLTIRDIDKIKRAFIEILVGMYHPSIEYPVVPSDEDARPGAPIETTLRSDSGHATQPAH